MPDRWDGPGGGPEGTGWKNHPSQTWMKYYDEEKCDWCGNVGICGCVTSLKPFENMVGKIVNMGGMSGCFGALVGAQRALAGEITPP